jgi:hypothetical protein
MRLSEANRRAERGIWDFGVLEYILRSATPGRDAKLDGVELKTLCDGDKLLGVIQARFLLPLRTIGDGGTTFGAVPLAPYAFARTRVVTFLSTFTRKIEPINDVRMITR